MQFDQKDLGYTIYRRLEEALRSWISASLLIHFGEQWSTRLPSGLRIKTEKRLGVGAFGEMGTPDVVLEETDIPDLAEIVCFKGAYQTYVQHSDITQNTFQGWMSKFYELRNMIAHPDTDFTALDFDLLLDVVSKFPSILGDYAEELVSTLNFIKSKPEEVVVAMPNSFRVTTKNSPRCFTNLPKGDYDSEGGFVGRQKDFKDIRKWLTAKLDRVITISGAGGVGKTALAHRICQSFLQDSIHQFDAIVWISTKEDRLTLSGIEPLEPMIRNFDELLYIILEVCEWNGQLTTDTTAEEIVSILLESGDNGILLVIDNLETIQDERILDFIKDVPHPNRVLITSRMGLGEIERRYPLKEFDDNDALAFIRTIAREKHLADIAKLTDKTLLDYADKMARYPLVMKWVLGQVARGQDINRLVENIADTSGDIAKFCFEKIYDHLLDDNERLVLCCLAGSDLPLTHGVLIHCSALQPDQLDEALRTLTIASLIIPGRDDNSSGTIITSYALLPLTWAYLKTKLRSQPELWRTIRDRLSKVHSLVDESSRANVQYRYALQELGATTDEERIAASWAATAYQEAQAGDYDKALMAFKQAIMIAPNFARIYRNWAVFEHDNGYHDTSDELMRKATKLSPEDPSIWYTWGTIKKKTDKFSESCQRFEKALALSPNDPLILAGLAETEKRRQNYERADALYRQALNPSSGMVGPKHEIMTLTALADNLRRWAEALAKDNKKLAFAKAQEAYDFICQASDRGDIQVDLAYREISWVMARLTADISGLDQAIPLFLQAAEQPENDRERHIALLAFLSLVRMLIQSNRRQEAQQYYQRCDKLSAGNSKDRERYMALRGFVWGAVGKVQSVRSDRGFGFIRTGQPPSDIFAHVSDFIPKISSQEFEDLIGKQVSFTVEVVDGKKRAKYVGVIE